jgi:hypothetical protein
MNRIRYVMAMFAGAAAIVLTFMGATAASAEVAPASTAAASDVQPMSNPPGACTKDELGDWKTDRYGIIHYCTYIPGEGYYWIPI